MAKDSGIRQMIQEVRQDRRDVRKERRVQRQDRRAERRHAAVVPEIDAASGLASIAALGAAMALIWERRRRLRGIDDEDFI
jgi:hypothetical protein